MAEIARKTRRYPSDLTDNEWERIAPLMPKPPPRGRKPTVDFREILNAIRYMARSAGGWRMLPSEFGPWQTVYCCHCRVNSGSSALPVLVVSLWGVHDAGTKQIEVGAAIHRPLQHFEATDLPLDGTGGPRQFERRANRGEVATEPRRKAREQGVLRCGEDLAEISGHLASKKRIQA